MQNFKHQLTFDVEPRCQQTLALSPNGKLIVTGGRDQNTVHVWDAQTGQLVNSWMAAPPLLHYGVQSPLHSLAITPDGSTLVTGGRFLKSWELETGKQIRVFKGATSYIPYVVISSDGNTLITENDTRKKGAGQMIVWDLKEAKKIRSCSPISSTYWLISPDCKTLVGREYEKSIKVWNLITGEEIRKIQVRSAIRSLKITFDRNWKLLAGGRGNDCIIIWDFETGSEIKVIDNSNNPSFQEHLNHIYDLIFSLDGNNLFSTGNDGIIQVWDVNTGKNVGTIPGGDSTNQLYMSNDGQTLIGFSAFTQKIDVWKQ